MLRSTMPMRQIALMQILLLLFLAALPLVTSASMIDTGTLVSEQELTHDREALKAMVDQEEVRDTLESMGVSPDKVQERIDSLTPEELADLNEQLAEAPAGEGVLGVLVVIFIVFIITDALCATDIFTFVRCIN